MAYKNWIKSVTYYVCCNVTKRPLHFNYSDTISCCQQPADLLVCIISHWCYCKFRSLVIAHYFFRFQARLLLFWMIKYVSNIIFDTNKRTNSKQTKWQTGRRQESNLVHISIKMWHMVAIFWRFSWHSTDQSSCTYWSIPLDIRAPRRNARFLGDSCASWADRDSATSAMMSCCLKMPPSSQPAIYPHVHEFITNTHRCVKTVYYSLGTTTCLRVLWRYRTGAWKWQIYPSWVARMLECT